MSISPRGRVGLALGISILLWASAFAVIRSATRDYPPGGMALLRFAIASLVLALYCLAARRRPRLRRRADFFPLLACGCFGVTIYHPLLNFGEKAVTAGTASLLINSSPVWTALLAIVVLGECMTLRKAMGVLLGFSGIAVLTLGNPAGGASYLHLDVASLAILGAALCSASYVIVQKKFLAAYTALEFTCLNIWLGTLLLVPFYAAETWRAAAASPVQATLQIAYLGIFPGALAYLAFAYATQRLPAARVMSFLYLVPAVAILIAWLYLHEPTTMLSLAGGALAIGGVSLVNTGVAKKNAVPVIAVEEA